MNPDSALWVVVSFEAAAVLVAWWYFRRIRIHRPPIGVMNLRDVALMIGAIVLVPYLYLALPAWFAAALLGLGLFSVLQVTFEPIVPGRWTSWIAALVLRALVWLRRCYSSRRPACSCWSITWCWRLAS
jgi:hypothetical protein